MQLISDFNRDTSTAKPRPGAYEWWYFDAIDLEERYSMVVIFYEGNPFSSRYIMNNEEGEHASAGHFPAVSISVYDYSKPIFYSFTEYEPEDCSFESTTPALEVGLNTMEGYKKENRLIYVLTLDEMLPSGLGISGQLVFESKAVKNILFGNEDIGKEAGHTWNLVQPYARVNGILDIISETGQVSTIEFRGKGYHDHNTGMEPMKNEFQDWYWGRFHFEDSSLVYYVMNQKISQQHRAWLIDNDRMELAGEFVQAELLDRNYSLFGLYSAKKILLKGKKSEVTIQHSTCLDNGPFYQRFLSEAILYSAEGEEMKVARGISEYINPSRIYWKLFWPLVNMRIWYKKKGAHWVQKSGKLYRWTW